MIQALTKNLGWKIASLALSAMIWFALLAEPPVVTSISVPVQYRNIPRDLEMGSDVIERVHMEVIGPSNVLTPERLADTAVVFDLASVLRPGERTFPIEGAEVNLPAGVTLQRTIPNQIRILFESRLEREVPVVIRYAAPPPGGYSIVGQRVRPQRLRIVGPASRVASVVSAETDPLDLGGVVGSAKFPVQTFVEDPQVRFASGSGVVVEVEVRRDEGPED